MIQFKKAINRALEKLDRWADVLAADRWFLLKLFLLAFILRAGLILLHPQVNLSADMLGYHESGISLLQDGELKVKGRISATRPPLYPIFIYLVYYLFGAGNVLALRLVQAGLGGLICMLTVYLGQKVFSRKVGVWAGIMFAVYPAAWTFADMVMSEYLFTVLLLAGLIYLADLPKGRYQDAVLAGIFLGLATLTRSVLYQFPLFFAVIYLVVSPQRFKQIPRLAVFVVSFWIVLMPWLARNNRIFGQPLMTTKSGVDLYFYNHNPFLYIIQNYSKENQLISGEIKPWTFSEMERDSLAKDAAVTWIKAHPLLFLFKGVRMQWNLFGVDREYVWWLIAGYWGHAPKWMIALAFPIFMPWVYLLIPLFIWGLVYSWKKYPAQIALLAMLAYNLAVTFVYYGFSRNRMPLNPLLMLFAGYALTQYQPILTDLKSPGLLRRPQVVVALGFLGFILVGWALELLIDMGSFLNLGFTGFDWIKIH
jgi:4-amino-4-deoxy-L-arabinose transferase-like glycosyltransferase